MTDDHPTITWVPACSYPLRGGNVVRPLVDGTPAFERICQAIEAATRSVWATITFMWETCEMPGGRGTALDVLDRAAARGLDVRIIFWRPDTTTDHWKRNAFWGSDDHISQLETRKSGVRIRWDQAQPGYCQHQKSWLIDAGGEDEVAFVGGINLNPNSMAAPGHRGESQNHDVYVELAGPATVDVHHNFVQRWNEASDRDREDGQWGMGSHTDLPFPSCVPKERGAAQVQIQRTMHAGRYMNAEPSPRADRFDVASGEESLFQQYCLAIDAAQRSIYIENQYITVLEILNRLIQALQRGVAVVALLPAQPATPTRYIHPDERDAFLAGWQTLSNYENFTLAGIAGLGIDGRRNPIYVHSKLMIVDDVWATVGSGNLHRFSLFGNAEMNVSFWCRNAVRRLRCELFQEHLDDDTSPLDDLSALRYFREISRQNRVRMDAGSNKWQGLAYSMDSASYLVD